MISAHVLQLTHQMAVVAAQLHASQDCQAQLQTELQSAHSEVQNSTVESRESEQQLHVCAVRS